MALLLCMPVCGRVVVGTKVIMSGNWFSVVYVLYGLVGAVSWGD